MLEVKVYEVKFLGMPVGRDDKRNLVRSKQNMIIHGIGEKDADESSPTYGKIVCKVGKTYKARDFQLKLYGGAFDMKNMKEVDSYVIDDEEDDETANKVHQEERKKRAAAAAKAEEKKRKEAEDEAEKRAKAEKKAAEEAAKVNTKEVTKAKAEKKLKEEEDRAKGAVKGKKAGSK